MATVITKDQAKQLLKHGVCHRLECIYKSKRRKMFYNDQRKLYGLLRPRCRTSGETFDWNDIQKVFAPAAVHPMDEVQKNSILVTRYKLKSEKATFKDKWFETIAAADTKVSLQDNHITSGSTIDGKVLNVSSIRTQGSEHLIITFLQCIKDCVKYNSETFSVNGNDCKLSVETPTDGYVAGFLTVTNVFGREHIYRLINEKELIGYASYVIPQRH